MAADDDVSMMFADLQKPDHRVGLIIVDDDSLTGWDLIYLHEGDGMRAIQRINVGGIIHSSHFRISPLRNSDGRHDEKFSTIPQAKMNVS